MVERVRIDDILREMSIDVASERGRSYLPKILKQKDVTLIPRKAKNKKVKRNRNSLLPHHTKAKKPVKKKRRM